MNPKNLSRPAVDYNNSQMDLDVAQHGQIRSEQTTDKQRQAQTRQNQRWQMLTAMQEAQNTKEENEQLKHELAEMSALANTSLLRSSALLRTIAHLKNVWAEDAPDSEVRKDAMNNLGKVYQEKFDTIAQDPAATEGAKVEMENAQKRAKTRMRR